ncbi:MULTISPECIES: copper amine oxidase N-terminal domain-containing protein [unclassified Paenibacillus]|uniref:copper amine oxidase N-terminal domain-containing protein n=1 Tax=unclassified Paenibacillus TaxID=185978 RepID=UPI0030FC882D
MKKMILGLISLIMIFCSFNVVVSADSSRKIIFVNDKRVVFDKDPVYENGTLLVQTGPLLKALALVTTYDKNTKTTKITNPQTNTSFSFTLGSKTGYINGSKTALTIAPKIIDGYTFVPLKFITTASNNNFVLDNNASRIYIGPFYYNTKDPYKEIEWGRNILDVKKAENKTLLGTQTGTNGAKTLMYRVYLGNDELPAQLWYMHDSSGKLENMFYVTEGDQYPGDQYTLYNQIVSDMNETFKPTTDYYADDQLWKGDYTEEIYDDLYGNDYDTKIGTALLQKDLVLITNFEYRDVSISVQLKNSGSIVKPDFTVTIYYDITQ